MRVFVNGETKEFESVLRLPELLARLEMPERRIAVELNRAVVRRQDWETTEVKDDDRIEIVQFVGGG